MISKALIPVIALGGLAYVMPVTASNAAEHFVAKLHPLNAAKIGTSASGEARLDTTDGTLTIAIDLGS